MFRSAKSVRRLQSGTNFFSIFHSLTSIHAYQICFHWTIPFKKNVKKMWSEKMNPIFIAYPIYLDIIRSNLMTIGLLVQRITINQLPKSGTFKLRTGFYWANHLRVQFVVISVFFSFEDIFGIEKLKSEKLKFQLPISKSITFSRPLCPDSLSGVSERHSISSRKKIYPNCMCSNSSFHFGK